MPENHDPKPGTPRSERTGFAKGDRVEWDQVVEDGKVVIPAGCGTVTVPNDGGFVWIAPDGPTHAPILKASDVRHVNDAIMPTTVDELWGQCWIAKNEVEAVAQAERMYDLFKGRKVAVDRIEVWDEGEFAGEGELFFQEPWPEVWVDMLSTERGWDGDVLYPEWYVRSADAEQVVTTVEGRTVRMGDLTGTLTTTAPGIGTLEGFGHRTGCPLVYPLQPESDHPNQPEASAHD